jgi:protein phosphatase 1K
MLASKSSRAAAAAAAAPAQRQRQQQQQQQQHRRASSSLAASSSASSSPSPSAPAAAAAAGSNNTRVVVTAHGSYTVRGTVRKVNEDRVEVRVSDPDTARERGNQPAVFAGCYDGHGGDAVAIWLASKLWGVILENWTAGARARAAIEDAYLAADRQLLSAAGGFLGLGERGVGGSRCGATAANALLFADPAPDAGGATALLTANAGDARVLLITRSPGGGGKCEAVPLYEEHVPDLERERERIERNNPNPKMPLVRYVAGTWRVGGLLALSRALGDSYLKPSLRFEGVSTGSNNNYATGFGLSAEPFTTLRRLTPDDAFVVLASDGLFAEEARGGGGGLTDEMVAELCEASGASAPCDAIAKALAEAAAAVGSTDDISVVVLRLGTADVEEDAPSPE